MGQVSGLCQCQLCSIVYKATITTDFPADSRVYIGCTDTTFRMRHYGHATDARVTKKDGGTELSKYVWGSSESKGRMQKCVGKFSEDGSHT